MEDTSIILYDNLYYETDIQEVIINKYFNSFKDETVNCYTQVVVIPTTYTSIVDLLSHIKNEKGYYDKEFLNSIENIVYENSIDLTKDFDIIRIGKYYHIKLYTKYCEV